LKEKAPEVRGLFLLDPLFTYAYEDISGPTPIYDTQQPTTMPKTNVLSNVILPRMRLAIPFLVLSFYLTAYAQAPTENPTGKNPAESTGKVDPKLHADVLKLMDLMGLRDLLESSMKPLVGKGKQEMMAQCPKCSPEFGEEWAKRMLARLKVDDFMEVYVTAYENHFTDAEITEMISLQSKKKDVPPPNLSPQLKERLNAIMPTLLSEIMGGCTQVGAKLGGEIGMEIGKEHPEFLEAKPESRSAN
jgi:hypothetical protein